jgi:O-antigen/teichoic acid export membrane protein
MIRGDPPPRPGDYDEAVTLTGPQGSDSAREASLGVEALLILLARVFGAVSSSVITIILAASLGSELYGVYALGMTIAATAGTFAELGIASAIGRLVADAHPDRPSQRAAIALGLRLKAYASLIVVTIMFAAAEPIADFFGGHSDQSGVVRAAALAVLTADLFATLATLFIAFRTARGNIILNVSKSVAELSLVIVFVVVLSGGPIGAILANAAGYAVGCTVGLVMLRRALRGARGGTAAVGPRELLRSARWIWYTSVPWVGFVTVDQLMLGAFKGPETVGIYDAPFRINTLFQFIGMSVASALAPRMVGGGDPVARSVLFTRTLRALLALYATIALAAVPFADELIAVTLGPSFAASAAVLRAILPYVALLGATPMMSMSLNYIGTRKAQVWLGLVTLALDAGLDLLLIPALGVIGPAIATDIAFAVYFVGHLVLCDRAIGLDWWALVRSSANGLLAGAVALSIGLAIDGIGLGDPLTLALGVTCSGVAGLGVLLLRREFDRSLVAALRHRS